VRLEASTKPHVHNLIHEFLINIAFTMACPNFKKGLKMVSGPLGVKVYEYAVSWNRQGELPCMLLAYSFFPALFPLNYFKLYQSKYQSNSTNPIKMRFLV
jgi:hypothetical protein